MPCLTIAPSNAVASQESSQPIRSWEGEKELELGWSNQVVEDLVDLVLHTLWGLGKAPSREKGGTLGEPWGTV